MERSLLQERISRLKRQSEQFKKSLASLQLGITALNYNIESFDKAVGESKRSFSALTSNDPVTAPVMYLFRDDVQAIAS